MLLRRIDLTWRLLGTGLGFVVFLGGGMLLALAAFPLIDLFTRGEAQRRDRHHAWIRGAFRAFIGMLKALRVITLRIDDPSFLQSSKGVIVVANHPTLIDIVLLTAFIPRVQCIVKRELWSSRLLGPIVRGGGYIPSDLDPESLIATCREALADGRSLIIFPEGTRSRPGVPVHFQRGFAHLAMLLQADIQLAFISCTPPTLAKGEKWWAIPSRRPHLHVSPAGRIPADGWQIDGHRSITVRNMVRKLERLYNERLATG